MLIWVLGTVVTSMKPVLSAGRGCGMVGVRIRIVSIIGIRRKMMKEAREIKAGKYRILRRMWRICSNPRSNDWNDEPEHLAVPYEILEEKEKSYVCMRAGWHQKNVLAKREFYRTKEECLAAIMERFMNFPAGTHKEDVWHWFDEKHSKGVYVLMHLGEGAEE